MRIQVVSAGGARRR